MTSVINKKGFMFIETIVTLTVLTAVLLLLYSTFVNLLGNEKRVTEYEKKGYRYALFYIKEWMIDNNVNLNNNTVFNGGNNFRMLAYTKISGNVVDDLFPSSEVIPAGKQERFNKMKNMYNLKTLAAVKCPNGGRFDLENDANFKDSYSGREFSDEFAIYLKSLGSCKEYNNKYKTYRLVGEFYDKESNTDYQAFIYYPNLEGGY